MAILQGHIMDHVSIQAREEVEDDKNIYLEIDSAENKNFTLGGNYNLLNKNRIELTSLTYRGYKINVQDFVENLK